MVTLRPGQWRVGMTAFTINFLVHKLLALILKVLLVPALPASFYALTGLPRFTLD